MQTVPTREPPPAPLRCVNEQGLSLRAEVCCAAPPRKKLEHLCRYITRRAIAAIVDPTVIAKILKHLGMSVRRRSITGTKLSRTRWAILSFRVGRRDSNGASVHVQHARVKDVPPLRAVRNRREDG